ncbi:hypothetical protein K9853_02415 [Lacticaseibacillus paracasei]|uniref:hypothetical protein n=1 Tax=Lacticaseibacillus paracasei TaxID=1597 RepID=UPI001EE040C9|nr:hypothetical protein [Lacticaseibacillus paracasei]MCG4283570.1 hypothetical protein [Lacticaseibacillus paracasei]
MSNETKRDVFDDAAFNIETSSPDGPKFSDDLRQRYNDALPDDLPVIPEAVGEYIQWGKSYDIQLYMMYSFKFIHSQGFKKLTDDVESWIISSSNAFARAWVLGVWKVKETDEVVKL